MLNTMIDSTPATGVSRSVAAEPPARTAPVSRHKGTAVPFGDLPAPVAFGARSSLQGLPPRAAPV